MVKIMNPTQLQSFVQNNPKLVKAKSFTINGHELQVLKYSKQVFYRNLWNDALEWCRGTVVDCDFNLVSVPFQKIYNYGIEKRAPKIEPETKVTAYRKVNGFMAQITWYKDTLIIGTTGSLGGDFVQYIKDMMVTHAPIEKWEAWMKAHETETHLFEVVHPDDPHIIPENAGMYYLGSRLKQYDAIHSEYGLNRVCQIQIRACDLGCFAAEGYADVPFSEIQSMVKQCKHEGFVIYTDDGKATKIKSQWYLVQKWVARNPNTDKIMNNQIFNQVDEEYYGLIYHLRNNIEHYTALDEQNRLEFVRQYFSSLD
jgi:hypothetical protein